MNTKQDSVCDNVVRVLTVPQSEDGRPAAMRTESVGLTQAQAPSVAVFCARALHQSAPTRPATRTVRYAPRALYIATNLTKYSNEAVR